MNTANIQNRHTASRTRTQIGNEPDRAVFWSVAVLCFAFCLLAVRGRQASADYEARTATRQASISFDQR